MVFVNETLVLNMMSPIKYPRHDAYFHGRGYR